MAALEASGTTCGWTSPAVRRTATYSKIALDAAWGRVASSTAPTSPAGRCRLSWGPRSCVWDVPGPPTSIRMLWRNAAAGARQTAAEASLAGALRRACSRAAAAAHRRAIPGCRTRAPGGADRREQLPWRVARPALERLAAADSRGAGGAERAELIDRLGIRRAAVALLDGVLLKDANVANAELHQPLIAGRLRGKLSRSTRSTPPSRTPPSSWSAAGQEYGLAAWHGKRGAPPSQLPALRATTNAQPRPRRCGHLRRLDLPVVLTLQLEDSRLHHPAAQVPDPEPAAVADSGEPVAGPAAGVLAGGALPGSARHRASA